MMHQNVPNLGPLVPKAMLDERVRRCEQLEKHVAQLMKHCEGYESRLDAVTQASERAVSGEREACAKLAEIAGCPGLAETIRARAWEDT